MSRKKPSRITTKPRGLNKVQKKEVDRKINRKIETKLFNEGSSIYGQDLLVDNNGTIHDLSTMMAANMGPDLREGHEVILQKVIFNCEVQASSSVLFSNDAWNTVRIILFRWREDTSAQVPLMSNILDTTSSSVCYSTQFPYNYKEREKYHILYDKVVKVSQTPLANGSTAYLAYAGMDITRQINVKLYGKKLGAKKIQFNDLTGPHGYNKLYALFCSDSTTTPDPIVNWNTQVFYKDA